MTIKQIPPIAPGGMDPEQWQRVRELIEAVNGMASEPLFAQYGVGDIRDPATTFGPGVWIDLWPGPTRRVPLVTAPVELEVVSADAANSAAGTGAQAMRLVLLDENFNQTIQEVELNGVTPVSVPGGPHFRLNASTVIRTGSYGWVENGAVDIREVSTGDVWSRLLVDTTRGRRAVLTVPVGVQFSIINMSIRMYQKKQGDSIEVEFQNRPLGEAWQVFKLEELDNIDALFQEFGNQFVRFPTGTDLRASLNVAGTPERISGSFSNNVYRA